MFMMPQVIIHGVPFKGRDDMTSPYTDQFWVAEGVCMLLKIKNPKKVITNLKQDEMWEISYKDKPDSDEITTQVLVNFSGLCSLMLCSESPVAEKFKRWLTQIVVPAVLEEGQMIPIELDLKEDLDNLGLLPY